MRRREKIKESHKLFSMINNGEKMIHQKTNNYLNDGVYTNAYDD